MDGVGDGSRGGKFTETALLGKDVGRSDVFVGALRGQCFCEGDVALQEKSRYFVGFKGSNFSGKLITPCVDGVEMCVQIVARFLLFFYAIRSLAIK